MWTNDVTAIILPRHASGDFSPSLCFYDDVESLLHTYTVCTIRLCTSDTVLATLFNAFITACLFVIHDDGGRGVSPPLVGLSARYLKNRCGYNHQTWHRNVPRWVLETYSFAGQKVKGRGQESQKMSARVFALLWVLAFSGLLCMDWYKISIMDTVWTSKELTKFWKVLVKVLRLGVMTELEG